MKKLYLKLLLIFFIGNFVSMNAQEKQDGVFSMLRSKDGVILIYNSGKNTFSIDIQCKDIKEIDSQEMIFLIDGKVLQFTPLPIVAFYPGTKVITDLEILEKHLNYEAEYSKYINGMNIRINQKKIKLKNGTTSFQWNYRMPKDPKDTASNTVRKQFFVNYKLDDAVLLLSSVATLKDNDKKIQSFLIKMLNNITVYPQEIDVEALSQKLKSSK